jgi:hypothetical protein
MRQLVLRLFRILLLAALSGVSLTTAIVISDNVISLYLHGSLASPLFNVFLILPGVLIFSGIGLVGALLLKLLLHITPYNGQNAIVNSTIIFLLPIGLSAYNTLSVVPFGQTSYYYDKAREALISFPIAIVLLSVLYSAVARIQQTSERHKNVLDESL